MTRASPNISILLAISAVIMACLKDAGAVCPSTGTGLSGITRHAAESAVFLVHGAPCSVFDPIFAGLAGEWIGKLNEFVNARIISRHRPMRAGSVGRWNAGINTAHDRHRRTLT